MTAKQAILLAFIDRHMRENMGITPSFDEMADVLGVSKSSIHRILTSLEEQGRIRRQHGRARRIEVLRAGAQ